jgi:hypothetical protein
MRYKSQKFAQFPCECSQTLHDGEDVGHSLRVRQVRFPIGTHCLISLLHLRQREGCWWVPIIEEESWGSTIHTLDFTKSNAESCFLPLVQYLPGVEVLPKGRDICEDRPVLDDCEMEL